MTAEGKKTVLLVEDERVTSMVTARAIQKEGYEVIAAYSGESAIEISEKSSNIDIILMDIELGDGIDGTIAAKIILSKKNLPIVFLSSHTEKKYVDKVKEIARYGYVVKNSGDFVLLSTIEMAFELFEAKQKEKKKNEDLIASETHYRSLVEGIPGIVYSFSNKRGGIYYSKQVQNVLGYTPEQLYKQPMLWNQSIHPDDFHEIEKFLIGVSQNQQFQVEYRICDSQGSWHWFDDRSFGYNKFGDELIIEGIAIDITKRKFAEDLLILRAIELSTTQEATISSMAILAEFRDPETGGHIQRTKLYVKLLLEKIADRLPYEPGEIELIWHSAPLHDIGKVGIPDSILLKPGSLTPEEFEVMKKHTLYGFDAIERTEKILGTNSFLNFAMEISKYHHEKWDGSGYPFALKGEEIPLSARVMALADVYDALVSERPYKKPMGHDSAIKIIESGSGLHFDPQLVKIFIENNMDFHTIARQYED